MKPVKCTLSREESFRIHAKRHPIKIEVWAGCDENGSVTALRSRMIGDSGPYASVGMKVLERAAGHMSGPYVIPNIDVEAIAARTNNPVCGAFRGFGANQAQFAMEGVIDRLADAIRVLVPDELALGLFHLLIDDLFGCLGSDAGQRSLGRVVGRLQHDCCLPYNYCNDLKQRLRLFEISHGN